MYRSRVSSCLPVLSVCVAGLLGGCASTGSHAPPAVATAAALSAEEVETIAERATTLTVEPTAPTDDTTICRKEQITGSHRTKTVCQTHAERRAVRSEAQEWYRTGGREGTVSRVPTVH